MNTRDIKSAVQMLHERKDTSGIGEDVLLIARVTLANGMFIKQSLLAGKPEAEIHTEMEAVGNTPPTIAPAIETVKLFIADEVAEAVRPQDVVVSGSAVDAIQQVSEVRGQTPYAGSVGNPSTVNGLIWPNEIGEFPTPIDGALWMASLGVAQTPLRPNTKDAFLPNFPALATTDPTTIRKWAADYPGCNFGSVSIEGKTFVFEADSADVRERFEKLVTGTFTSKLSVQSSPGKGHRYYLHTSGIATVQQAFTKHGDFSIRAKNQYCVSPGSIHPTTQQQYRVFFHDLANGLTAPTESEIAFWNSERANADDFKKEVPRDTKTGLVPHGYIHGFMLREAGRLRAMGYDLDIIEPALLQTVYRNCQPPIDDNRVRQMARSICKYPAGTPADVILNQIADLNEEEEETFEEEKRKVYLDCPIFPGALTDLARAIYPSLPLEFKMWGLMTRWGLRRSGIDKLAFEEHIQPRPYTIFVCLPNIGKTASINESRKSVDAIVKRVGMEYERLNNTRPTPRVCGTVTNLASVDSGQFLAKEFYEIAKQAQSAYLKDECTDTNAKLLIDADELKDVFDKGRSTQNRSSTIFTELLKLHSGNRTGNSTKKEGKRNVENAHLAMVVGTTIANYPNLWVGTGSGADGLRSRFNLITTNNPPAPPSPLKTDFVEEEKALARLTKLAMLPGQTVSISEEASKMLDRWWSTVDKAKDSSIRILEFIKQALIILAVTNAPEDYTGTTLTVGTDLMASAIQYGKYEIAIREEFNLGDSCSHIQSMENAIIKWFQKNGCKRSEPRSRNDVRRGINAHRLPGGLGAFRAAWDNCINTGMLKLRAKTQRASLYSL